MLAKILGEVFNNLSPAIPTNEEAAFLVGEFQKKAVGALKRVPLDEG